LFIVVMDVLNVVIKLGEEAGMFASLEGSGIRHKLSLYADDVVMLIRPTVEEATAALHLVNTFGEASGLRCKICRRARRRRFVVKGWTCSRSSRSSNAQSRLSL
jgi:hypothetical protein